MTRIIRREPYNIDPGINQLIYDNCKQIHLRDDIFINPLLLMFDSRESPININDSKLENAAMIVDRIAFDDCVHWAIICLFATAIHL